MMYAAILVILALMVLTSGVDGGGVFPDAFPFKDGFLGGDAIYSVHMGSERYVWLYGDTFWNNIAGNISRTFNPEEFPSNSVGITHVLDGKKAEFEYFKGNGVAPYGLFNHAPASMIGLDDEQREKLRIWPKDGQLIGGNLVVGLVLIVESENMFDTLGVDYALVENPNESPDNWKVTYIQCLRSASVFPATSLTEHDGYLYSLTTIIRYLKKNQQRQTMALLRYSTENFDITQSVPEYYSVDGEWKALTIDSNTLRIIDEKTVIDDIKVISEHGNTEATLHFDEDSGKWVMITSRGLFDKATISMLVSDSPTGPFSEPMDLIPGYPDSTRSSDDFIQGVFCYAGKGHPELSKQFYTDSMMITYACNSFDMDQLLDDNNVYVPKAVIIEDFQSKIATAAHQAPHYL